MRCIWRKGELHIEGGGEGEGGGGGGGGGEGGGEGEGEGEDQLTHLTYCFDDRLIVASEVQTEKISGHRFLPSLLLDQHRCPPEMTLGIEEARNCCNHSSMLIVVTTGLLRW